MSKTGKLLNTSKDKKRFSDYKFYEPLERYTRIYLGAKKNINIPAIAKRFKSYRPNYR